MPYDGPLDRKYLHLTGFSRQFIFPRGSQRFWIASAFLRGPHRSHAPWRKTETSRNYSEQAANPGVPYGKVVRKTFHADSAMGVTPHANSGAERPIDPGFLLLSAQTDRLDGWAFSDGPFS